VWVVSARQAWQFQLDSGAGLLDIRADLQAEDRFRSRALG
jgi:hypothetical protein